MNARKAKRIRRETGWKKPTERPRTKNEAADRARARKVYRDEKRRRCNPG